MKWGMWASVATVAAVMGGLIAYSIELARTEDKRHRDLEMRYKDALRMRIERIEDMHMPDKTHAENHD